MKAQLPIDNQWDFFFDKCLAFGSAISCTHFQRVSNAVAHIITVRTKRRNVNYLDDYMFCALLKLVCNGQVQEFLEICDKIGLPVAIDKTSWGVQLLTFLGFLINTVQQIVLIPCEKVAKGLNMINFVLEKEPSKDTFKKEIKGDRATANMWIF